MGTKVDISRASYVKNNYVIVSVIDNRGSKFINISTPSADTCMFLEQELKKLYGVSGMYKRASFETEKEFKPEDIEDILYYHIVEIKHFTGSEWFSENIRITTESLAKHGITDINQVINKL